MQPPVRIAAGASAAGNANFALNQRRTRVPLSYAIAAPTSACASAWICFR
jgi:hypothetical protein